MGMSETSLSRHGDAAGTTVIRRLPVELTVNGQLRSMAVEARTTLLDTLRDELGLTGTKKECDHGECGAACTVHVDGRRILSCITLTAMQDGKRTTTIDGLERDGTRSFFAAARAACLMAAMQLMSFTSDRSATERISRGTSPRKQSHSFLKRRRPMSHVGDGCHYYPCRRPITNRFYHSVLHEGRELRFDSSHCVKQWRRNLIYTASVLPPVAFYEGNGEGKEKTEGAQEMAARSAFTLATAFLTGVVIAIVAAA
jgi:hypothetical protein